NNLVALNNVNLYRILCPIKLKKYEKEHGRVYEKDQVIYHKGMSAEKIYLINKGKVKLVNYDDKGGEIVKQILVKGELFGENIILSQCERKEYAVACQNKTSVCSMNLTTMKQLMREDQRFSTAIYKLIGLRFRKIERRLELLLGKDVASRVASFVYDLYEEQQNETISHSFSQKDMASLLATSRESVAKVFNQMKNDQLIDYSRKQIRIKNLASLRKMSE
ncbi:MAG: Crp/Fnr family transcriptional regulator, partial [Chitinophagales bacterium]